MCTRRLLCLLLLVPLAGCRGEGSTVLKGLISVVEAKSAAARPSKRSVPPRKVENHPSNSAISKPALPKTALAKPVLVKPVPRRESWFVQPGDLTKPLRPWKPKACQRVVSTNWFQKASLLAGRKRLKPLLRKHKVRIGWRVHMLVTRVVPGVNQPSFVYESLGNTGFIHSKGRFYPASTVKLMAAVGALVRLHKYGLDGDTPLKFSDSYGTFRGSLYKLYKRAIGMSTNPDYDRLVRVATQLRLNREILHRRYGMPTMSIRAPFGGGRKLGYSPPIQYKKGKKKGVLPARQAPPNLDKLCPYRSNCATLFELQEGLRRVILHNELPKRERFPLPKKDVKRLQNTLLAAWSGILLTVRDLWTREAKIWCKGGCFRPHDHLENAYVEGPKGQRIFVTISIPFTKYRPKLPQTTAQLQYLARGILRAYDELAQGPPLQPDAGLPMGLTVTRSKGQGRLFIRTDPKVSQINAWAGQQKLQVSQLGPGQFVSQFTWPTRPLEAFVVQGLSLGKPTSYRSILVQKPGVWLPTCP